MFLVENWDKKNKQMFWEEYIKNDFCRISSKKVLTFQMSKNEKKCVKLTKNSEYLKI